MTHTDDHTMTVRIPRPLAVFLKNEAKRMSHQRGYRKSVNQLIIDLVRTASQAEPGDRPWTWGGEK